MRKHVRIHVVVLLTVVASQSEVAWSEPFVSAFDRFGRHGEIDTSVAGKLLIGELSCSACHASDEKSLTPKRGPQLHDAGTRLNADWMRRYLASPHTIHPGTTMPDVLVGKSEQERDRIAAELTAFLMSQTNPLASVKASGTNPVPFEFWKKGDAKNGKSLYHRVGCVACHEPDESVEVIQAGDAQLNRLLDELDPDELAEMGLTGAARKVRSVPQSDLAAKYSRQSLTFFLADPLQARPAGRMPNLKLTAIEAADIAAYLQPYEAISIQDPTSPNARTISDVQASPDLQANADDSVIERGRRAFVVMGCVQCHDARGVESVAAAKPLHQLDVDSGGCLDAVRLDYLLDEQQTDAIRDAIAACKQDLKPDASLQLKLTLLQLNCFACHTRDAMGGVGRYRTNYFHSVDDIDLGDEGRLPPPLTHIGQKLTKTHFTKVLLGKKADIRPHMRIRMPVFPAELVDPLPAWFARIDKADASPAAEVFGDTRNTEPVGRELMDVGCVQCHAFRGHTLPGVVGVDLQGIDSRVHSSWFGAFLLNPGSLKSRTRMPTFFPDGKSQHPRIFDGDPTRQIGAMWAYLKDLSQQPLPEKVEQARSENYELVPIEQPVVLRTFIQDVGTHAIAVGFPQKVHYVFDSQNGRFAALWRGRFLDAQGTWFIRFTPPAVPLGDDIMIMPHERMFDEGSADAAYQFAGYRLDSQRVPTFLYSVGGCDIEDRIVPDDADGLRRTITIRTGAHADSPKTIWLGLNDGKSLLKKSDTSYVNDRGLTVSLIKPNSNFGRIRDYGNGTRWSVPVEVEHNASIEVQYSW